MGGLNSLSGLNRVNVDYKTTVGLAEPKPDKSASKGLDNVKGAIVQEPAKANAKSVVKQLDVLLLNAARKSIGSDIKGKLQTISDVLANAGIIDANELKKLVKLADEAADALSALDKFSGKDLAGAVAKKKVKVDDWSNVENMKDPNAKAAKVTKEVIDWAVCYDDESELTDIAKAVTDAIDKQMALSQALSKFNEKIARSTDPNVTAGIQDQFTELQLQCDRRASEIDSLVFKMYALSKTAKDAITPKEIELLTASFSELMAREAITSHGTAGDFEKIGKEFEKFRPLAETLDQFANNGSMILDEKKINSLKADIAAMKEALKDVRENGIDKREVSITKGALWWKKTTTFSMRTEVDRSILDEMENVLKLAEQQIDHAKDISLKRTVDAFLNDVKESLSPENAPGFNKKSVDKAEEEGNVPEDYDDSEIDDDNEIWDNSVIGGGNEDDDFNVIDDIKRVRDQFISALKEFAANQLEAREFNTKIAECVSLASQVFTLHDVEDNLLKCGLDEGAVNSFVKTFSRLNLIADQLKELKTQVDRQVDEGNAKFTITTSDVRRIMLGEAGLSNTVEAKIRGFKQTDVDPEADESNIVSSKQLGSGNASKTYLLTTKTGEEIVFKPELDSRLGLDSLLLGSGNAYKNAQTTANLNLATQDTAKAFGCEDLVVKYSVGNHNGQFGMFMEKANGYSGKDFANKVDGPDDEENSKDGIQPGTLSIINDMVQDSEETKAKIQSQVAQKLNKLHWLDMITGQGDRHYGNYFVHIAPGSFNVTLKAIDNDASFSERQIGLQKYRLDADTSRIFKVNLQKVCNEIHRRQGGDEFNKRVWNDPSIEKETDVNGNVTSITVDISKAKSPEVKMAILNTIGMHTLTPPDEIDKDFYDKLMAMKKGSAAREEFLNSIAPRLSEEALKATEKRLDDAIAHAEQLERKGKVYTGEDWRKEEVLNRKMDNSVLIEKSDGKKEPVFAVQSKSVNELCVRGCSSYYARDFFNEMFK